MPVASNLVGCHCRVVFTLSGDVPRYLASDVQVIRGDTTPALTRGQPTVRASVNRSEIGMGLDEQKHDNMTAVWSDDWPVFSDLIGMQSLMEWIGELERKSSNIAAHKAISNAIWHVI